MPSWNKSIAEFYFTFKLNINISQFCLLKNKAISTLKCFTFTFYSAPPDSLAGLKGEGREEVGRGGRGKGEEGKGKDPQCLKCVDAPGVEGRLGLWRVNISARH